MERPIVAVTALAVRLMVVMKVAIAACMTAPVVRALMTAIALRPTMNVRNLTVWRIARAIHAIKPMGQVVTMDSSA